MLSCGYVYMCYKGSTEDQSDCIITYKPRLDIITGDRSLSLYTQHCFIFQLIRQEMSLLF